ncbi:MAG: hypothetical protein QM820_28600 [Minicystis sp.]
MKWTDEPGLKTDALTQNALTQNALTQNALTQNALTQNALTQNALTQNALTQNALTQNALTQNALTQNALEDPNARELFEYIVSCALPKGQSLTYTTIDGTAHTFDGELGLAPEWSMPGGKCGKVCQQWVSGCVLSRLDYLGEHVTISIRGTNPAIVVPSWPEYVEYTHREATYYGNIFSQPQQFLGCLPPGVTQDPRVCGPSVDDCVVKFTGSCENVCAGSYWAGGYMNCRGPMDHNEQGATGTMSYLGSVTVFLDE